MHSTVWHAATHAFLDFILSDSHPAIVATMKANAQNPQMNVMASDSCSESIVNLGFFRILGMLVPPAA